MRDDNAPPYPFNPWLLETKPYAAGKTFEYVMEKYGFKREEILRLAGNESTIGTSPLAIQAAQEAALSSNFYDEPNSESLLESLVEKFQREGLDMSGLGVVAGNGMDSVIEHVIALFTTSNSSIVIQGPTFIYYEFTAKRHGVEVINVAREEIQIDGNYTYKVNAQKIIESVKANTKVVFVCSPNNPDGSVVDLASLEYLASSLLKKEIILFIDHAYIDFAEEKYHAKSLVEKYPNIIIGYTFSKAYGMAGFRVGYGLMAKELQAKYLALNTPFLISKISIAAAKAALLDIAHYQKILENNKKSKPYLIEELTKLGYKVYKSESNFLLFQSPQNSGITADIILERLMSKGVIIRAMPSVDKFSLRVTVGTEAENQRFIDVIK